MKKQIALGILVATMLGTSGAYAAQQQASSRPDANRNAVTTRADVQANAAASFARLDVNRDGKLDQADRTARREAMKTRAFERLDTDKNGQISKAEFMVERTPSERGASRPDRGEWRGKGPKADGTTRDGSQVHRGRGHHEGGFRGGFGGRMGSRGADANNDGAVTAAEYTNAALARFDAMDSNKDGQVTQAERQAAREKMREQRRAPQNAAPKS